MSQDPSPAPPRPPDEELTLGRRLRILLFGAPRDFRDPSVFHKISLIAFLAWVGLGADGLSSSAYGPDECFRGLLERGNYGFMAIFLALATALTVFIISYAYSRVIEHFPSGGGGYLVATKLLGNQAGVISGCALLVDYVLTITVSVASGGEAIFNMLPLSWHHMTIAPSLFGHVFFTSTVSSKMVVALAVLLLLIVLNLRGTKESVTALMPVFLVFVLTHVILIVGGIISHASHVSEIATGVSAGFQASDLSRWGIFLVFLSAYSRGGGTYTGIEAVSNGLQIMREPRVGTGKRTMVYMSTSLAFTAGGILLCYLLFNVRPQEGHTMNGVLVEAFAGTWRPFGIPLGHAFVILTLASEGALLFVAAQTGFIDGPRVMANMAVDSWLPHRFASLSDRLTTKDGVILIGLAAIALLLGTGGSVDTLVVMYSINVFVTFSLSQLGMCRFWLQERKERPDWTRKFSVHFVGLILCVAILTVTVLEKFGQGAWLTLVITAICVGLCILVRRHYLGIARKLASLDSEFEELPSHDHHGGEPDPKLPTAVLLVGKYGGVGVHSVLSIQRTFPNHFKNLIFVSVAVIDSGTFKGATELDAQSEHVKESLKKYVALARRLGWNADFRTASGIDGVYEITRLCIELARVYTRVVFFAGKLLWKREAWYQRFLHNETAFQVQRRLQWKGLPMTVLPLRVPDKEAPVPNPVTAKA